MWSFKSYIECIPNEYTMQKSDGECVLKLHFILLENLLCTHMVHNNHQIDPMTIELCNFKKMSSKWNGCRSCASLAL